MLFSTLGMVETADMRYLFVDPPGNPSWKPSGVKGIGLSLMTVWTLRFVIVFQCRRKDSS